MGAVLGPHHIPSVSSCSHEDACECVLEFSCPLCLCEATDLASIQEHYERVHWDAKIFIGKYVLFPCGLSHATARQSIALPKYLHFHCPVCTSTALTADGLKQHVSSAHPAVAGATAVDVPSILSDACSGIRGCGDDVFGGHLDTQASRLAWSDQVKVREFPLALSIVEQAGGRSETKKSPSSHENFISLHEMAAMTTVDIEPVGCNRKALRLFKDCCFLIVGIDVAPHTFTAIHSLGGCVTGANYAESGEWSKITHVLLGDRLGPKSVKQLRRMLGVMFPQSDSLHWVSSEWVRDRVEHGTLFGTQTIFSPALIERFFTMRESANRSERRRTVRARPDIPILTVPIPEVPSRRPSPPVVESSETSFQFRSTPEASPFPSAAPLDMFSAHKENSNPSPVVEAAFLVSEEPAVKPRRTSITKSSIESSPLRRSKRASVMVSAGKFSLFTATHHSIKKE